MSLFKTVYFHRLAEHEGMSNSQIVEIVKEVEAGLHDGDLGGGVFKKRIAIRSRGKRGGLRSIIAYKQNDKAIFLYGYAKNVQDNINRNEKEAFKKLSKAYLILNDLSIKKLLNQGELIEVRYE